MYRFTLSLFLLLSLPTWAQMSLSSKLGEHDGLPGISIGQSLPIKQGFTEISRENSIAAFFESEYFETKIIQVDPVAVKYSEVYGLPVERIEVLVVEQDEENEEGLTGEMVLVVSEIAVFLKLPGSDKELNLFLEKFSDAYAPESDVMGYTEEMVPLMQWESTTDCGAIMSLPMLTSLKEFIENGFKHVPIRFYSSCGG